MPVRRVKEERLLKKLSKRGRSNLLNALVIITTLGIVLYLSAQGGDLGKAWEAVMNADLFWIGMALVSWLVFMTFEGMGLYIFLLQQKQKVRFTSSFIVAMIGSFYSAVTPAATGGQPMQVFAYKKRGVPTGFSSSGLAVKFFTFQTALLTMGGLLWLFNGDAIGLGVETKVWATTGFILNGFTVAVVLLLAINKNIVRWIITLCIKLGKAIRLVKNEAKLASKVDAAMEDFHASVHMITHHPLKLLWLLFHACLNVLGLMSISYFIYRALGLNEHSYLDILTRQFLLYISASFTPLPGASGAQEGGFFLFFKGVFPDEMGVGPMLLWRFFTYYFTLITGFIAVLLDSTYHMRQKKKAGAVETVNIEKGAEGIASENSEASGSADASAESDQ